MDAAIAFLRSLAANGAAVEAGASADAAAAPTSPAAPISNEDRAAMADVNPRVSLVASDENDAVVGLALCRIAPQAGEPHCLQVKVSPQRPDLVRTLIDKALLKLHARGIHKCRIAIGDDEPNEVWHAARWLDHLPQDEPQAA